MSAMWSTLFFVLGLLVIEVAILLHFLRFCVTRRVPRHIAILLYVGLVGLVLLVEGTVLHLWLRSLSH